MALGFYRYTAESLGHVHIKLKSFEAKSIPTHISSVKVRLAYTKGFGKAMCPSWPWLGWVDGERE